MPLSSQLESIKHLLKQNNHAAALEQCRGLLQQHPESFEVPHLLGLTYLRQQRPEDAEHYFRQALRLAPSSPHVLNDLGIARLRQEKHDEAAQLFERALAIDPKHSDALNNMVVTLRTALRPDEAKKYITRLMLLRPLLPQTYVTAADNCLAVGEIEQAIRYGRKAVRRAPNLAAARLTLADALEAGGRFKQARFEYLALLDRNPWDAAALVRLLALKGTPVPDAFADRARDLLKGKALTELERADLHLALAHHHDQRMEYDPAFEHLRCASRLRANRNPFDHTQFAHAIDRLINAFPSDSVRWPAMDSDPPARPIFIVGMPRSGTTLLEQIIASHPRVAAGGELPTIINIAAQVGHKAGQYPEGIHALDEATRSKLARQYLARLERVSSDAERVTDKMPFNFMHLGLIALLLPGARIIHCRRDPLDICVSCCFTAFSEHSQFPSDLEGTGRYYLGYRRLMDHWRAVLPGRMLEVDYERLVFDTEVAMREVLEFCALEWHPSCLEFYRSKRGVRTPSRWQVRQPIYKGSVGRARHYVRHLQRLSQIITPVSK